MITCAKILNNVVEDIIDTPDQRVLELMFPHALIVNLQNANGEPFIGGYFIKNTFIPPSPHNGWILDNELLCWVPPISYPDDNKKYYWNDKKLLWEPIPLDMIKIK